MLNSFEELCIMLAAADNSFAREFNPHGGAYIVIHRQTIKVGWLVGLYGISTFVGDLTPNIQIVISISNNSV